MRRCTWCGCPSVGSCAAIAVLFEQWEVREASGRVVLEGRPLVPEVTPGSQPAGEEILVGLQHRVQAKADEVRALKTHQGLNNKVNGGQCLVVTCVAWVGVGHWVVGWC